MESREIEELSNNMLLAVRAALGLPDQTIRKMKREKPILVRDLDLDPSYWFVPLVYEDSLVGFLRVSLNGEMLAYGRFPSEKAIPAEYLLEDKAYDEIAKAFGQQYEEIERPHLIHDGPREKITWMSMAKKDDKSFYLFWAFGAEYSRSEKETSRYLI